MLSARTTEKTLRSNTTRTSIAGDPVGGEVLTTSGGPYLQDLRPDSAGPGRRPRALHLCPETLQGSERLGVFARYMLCGPSAARDRTEPQTRRERGSA